MRKNFITFTFILYVMCFLQSCAPVVTGIGAVAISGAATEKGIGTAFNDNVIKIKILDAVYKYDKSIGPMTKINVEQGAVLITGTVKNSKQKIKLTQIAWNVRNVTEVNNKVQIQDKSNMKNVARDLASVGEIRAKILANPDINSLNFSVDVVNDVVYLSGIANNENEVNLVTRIASEARFVKKVLNFIKINQDKR